MQRATSFPQCGASETNSERKLKPTEEEDGDHHHHNGRDDDDGREPGEEIDSLSKNEWDPPKSEREASFLEQHFHRLVVVEERKKKVVLIFLIAGISIYTLCCCCS